MAGADQSHLSCQVRVIRAENVAESKNLEGGSLFVRTYLSAGADHKNKARRVQLNTQGLPISPPESRFAWDESYSLDCRGALDSVSLLRRGSVTFELRWRPATRGWPRSPSSKLLGAAELPWEPAFSSPGSEIQAWLPLALPSNSSTSSAGLLVAITVKPETRGRRGVDCRERSCGCGNHGNCQQNYQLFVLAAALDSF